MCIQPIGYSPIHAYKQSAVVMANIKLNSYAKVQKERSSQRQIRAFKVCLAVQQPLNIDL